MIWYADIKNTYSCQNKCHNTCYIIITQHIYLLVYLWTFIRGFSQKRVEEQPSGDSTLFQRVLIVETTLRISTFNCGRWNNVENWLTCWNFNRIATLNFGWLVQRWNCYFESTLNLRCYFQRWINNIESTLKFKTNPTNQFRR